MHWTTKAAIVTSILMVVTFVWFGLRTTKQHNTERYVDPSRPCEEGGVVCPAEHNCVAGQCVRLLDPRNNYAYTCSGTGKTFATYNRGTLTAAQHAYIKKRYPSIWNQPAKWACVQGCTKGSCDRYPGSENPNWWR